MNSFKKALVGDEKSERRERLDGCSARGAMLMKSPGRPAMPQYVFEALSGKQCGNCSWLFRALLDGDPNKGICNYGSGEQNPPASPSGNHLQIVDLHDRACAHYKARKSNLPLNHLKT